MPKALPPARTGTPTAWQAVTAACAAGSRVGREQESSTASGGGGVQVGDEVRGGCLGAEVVDVPAAQPEHLGDEPGGEGVPFAVGAGDGDPAAGGGSVAAAGGARMDEGGDHAVVDGGGGVFLGDGDPAGGPCDADLRLDGGDDVEEQVLLVPAGVEGFGDEVDGGVLAVLRHRFPEPVAQFRGGGTGPARGIVAGRLGGVAGARPVVRALGGRTGMIHLLLPVLGLSWPRVFVHGGAGRPTAMPLGCRRPRSRPCRVRVPRTPTFVRGTVTRSFRTAAAADSRRPGHRNPAGRCGAR
ncbi:hypothetical protein GCM10020256_71130 [Streptomyces thermocoprophilus]